MRAPTPARVTKFTLGKPVPGLQGYVGRRVLVNLLKGASVSKVEPLLHLAYNILIHRWRVVATALCKADSADFLRKRLMHFLNCDPTGVYYSMPTSSILCDLPDLCPHCYSRRAQRVFVSLRDYFSGINATYRNDYFLYRYKACRKYQGSQQSLRNVMKQTFERGRDFFRHTDVDGGFNLVSVVPDTQYTWKIMARGFLVGGAGLEQSQLDAAYPLANDGRRLWVYQSPGAKEIATCVANSLRYPAGLLRADKFRLAELLSARRNVHQMAFYGALRKPRSPAGQDIDPDDMVGTEF